MCCVNALKSAWHSDHFFFLSSVFPLHVSCMAGLCMCVYMCASPCMCVQLDIQSRLTKVHSLSLSSDSTEESFCTVRPDQVCTALCICVVHVNFIMPLSLICIHFNFFMKFVKNRGENLDIILPEPITAERILVILPSRFNLLRENTKEWPCMIGVARLHAIWTVVCFLGGTSGNWTSNSNCECLCFACFLPMCLILHVPVG